MVDYGTYESIATSDLRPIDAHYLTLPCGAARCRLSGVLPAGGSPDWSHTAYEVFREMVLNKTFFAIAQVRGLMYCTLFLMGAIIQFDLFLSSWPAT